MTEPDEEPAPARERSDRKPKAWTCEHVTITTAGLKGVFVTECGCQMQPIY